MPDIYLLKLFDNTIKTSSRTYNYSMKSIGKVIGEEIDRVVQREMTILGKLKALIVNFRNNIPVRKINGSIEGCDECSEL